MNWFLGKKGKQTKKPIDSDKDDKETDDNAEKDECVYNCQQSGGCSVRIISKSFVSGATMGSCFSERFGGTCTGIPERCNKCLPVCKEKPGKQFSLPAKDEWVNLTIYLYMHVFRLYCNTMNIVSPCFVMYIQKTLKL